MQMDEIIIDERNIPAYAGKTNTGDKQGKQGEEHPRVCGENVHATDILMMF